MQRLRYGSKKSARLLVPSRIVKDHETGFTDFVTFCDAICESCDECPRYISDCNGDRRSQPWSGTDDYLNETFRYNVYSSDNAVNKGYAVDRTLI